MNTVYCTVQSYRVCSQNITALFQHDLYITVLNTSTQHAMPCDHWQPTTNF
jgi:hypothetical protein